MAPKKITATLELRFVERRRPDPAYRSPSLAAKPGL
jgi:hypothetical protein